MCVFSQDGNAKGALRCPTNKINIHVSDDPFSWQRGRPFVFYGQR